MKDFLATLRDRLPGPDSIAELLEEGLAWKVLSGMVLVVFLYYAIGMSWTHHIEDDLEFAPAEGSIPEGGSRAVAMAAALIDREVNKNEWVANSPFFLPSAGLDNMPNFQQGIIAALGRFAFELTDQIGRTRGSSKSDADLQNAAGELQYPGNVWLFKNLLPTIPSDSHYRTARDALIKYNNRLAKDEAVFERRADNLIATLDRIALDLGSSSAALDKHVREQSGDYVDLGADDLFYFNKGQLYAYCLVLRDLEHDFADIVRSRDVSGAFAQVIESLREAAALAPLMVANGEPDGLMWPNHLTTQGFYLLRARTQLREITQILTK